MGVVCSKNKNPKEKTQNVSLINKDPVGESQKRKKSQSKNRSQIMKSQHNKNLQKLNFSNNPLSKKLYSYHQQFHDYQVQYFDEQELSYYQEKLQNEKKVSNNQILQKNIKCKDDKILGNGSYGTVTRGFDVNNRLNMAIKRIYIGKSNDSQKNQDAIIQEVNFLKELKHPNIVKYYGYDQDDDYLKIYLEYVDMGSISSMLKTYGPFPEEVVIRYTKQILLGLEYLHYHGVIHRDIKGANILVSSEGLVKLSDFGSAKKLQQSYVSSFIGTTCWMAPEIILDKNYERFADIWSLGCTVYEMLTGKPPFMGNTHYEISVKVINYREEEYVFPDYLSIFAKDFILCCLKKNPYKRYNVKKLLSHPFILKADINFAEEIFEEASQLEFEEENEHRVQFRKSDKVKEESTGISSFNNNTKKSFQNEIAYNGKVKEIYQKLNQSKAKRKSQILKNKSPSQDRSRDRSWNRSKRTTPKKHKDSFQNYFSKVDKEQGNNYQNIRKI